MAQLERGRPEVLQAKQSSFGRWLKIARQKKGWSGEMLAAAVETSQSMISAYERGFRFPRREKAAELATALGADPREALEALMADTPGLEDAPEITREIDEELLQDSLMAYSGPNPILRAAKAAAMGQQIISAEEMAQKLRDAEAAGSVGGGRAPLPRHGRGPRKGITKIDE